ncbi:anti sigma factor C-terminal domain-containing protein [Clostridium sp. BSD9I1]|uniref:anti sigma factor C-terminal domain-containing protein n=1 Tax=Clostridium sp. BSD9I1 TaxID=2003589 RepID=UPI001647A611|nr:anti sigma factor C-terminal domain-containing protein [Clostridium sp. BSD9I1]
MRFKYSLNKYKSIHITVIVLILFSAYYTVSYVVNSFYYNPCQKSVGKYHEDLYFDLKVFSELNLPGYAVVGADSEKLGFGKYNIHIEQLNLFNRERKYIDFKIKRDDKFGNFRDILGSDYLGFTEIKQPNIDISVRNKEFINHIKELNPVSYVSAYIALTEDLNLKEFDDLSRKYNNKISFKWVGVRTEDKGKPTNYLSGFNPNFNDGSVSSDSADKNKYPYLQLIDCMTDEKDINKFNNGSMVEAYTKHFTSLLKYMNDREKAVTALEFNSVKIDYYKNALNYVEKNGINIYGFLVYGEARELLEFINYGKIKGIEINGVLPSKYKK